MCGPVFGSHIAFLVRFWCVKKFLVEVVVCQWCVKTCENLFEFFL